MSFAFFRQLFYTEVQPEWKFVTFVGLIGGGLPDADRNGWYDEQVQFLSSTRVVLLDGIIDLDTEFILNNGGTNWSTLRHLLEYAPAAGTWTAKDDNGSFLFQSIDRHPHRANAAWVTFMQEDEQEAEGFLERDRRLVGIS